MTRPVAAAVDREPLLDVAGLGKRFGGLVAVRDLSFVVPAGSIIGLIGPNGAGKSTTLALLMGALRPDTGRILLRGEDVTGHPTHELVGRGVARTFQLNHPLHQLSVRDNLRIPLYRGRWWPASGWRLPPETVTAVAARVGLTADLLRFPDALSHAGLKRLEVARAIATGAELLLLDEPFAGLSQPEVEALSHLLRELRDEGHTIVLVDHNVAGVARLVDWMVVMNAGEKLSEGKPTDILKDAAVRTAYLGDEALRRVRRVPVRPLDGASLLEVDGLEVSYGRAVAIQGASFAVPEGRFVSLIGPNGAGKTTTLDAIFGFRAHRGAIRFRGSSLGRGSADAFRRGLGYCTERRNLFGDLTVHENLLLGAYYHDPDRRARAVDEVFALFPRLRERASQRAVTLSGGEQQMLAIARALMSHPAMLLLDEPTLGLAPLVVDAVSDALWELQAAGRSILLAEQNVTFALVHSDHLHVIDKGMIRHAGSPEQLGGDTGLLSAYLGI